MDNSNQMIQTVSEANANVDLGKFIEQHITENEFPNKTIVFEQLEISEDLQRYKEFLAEQTQELKTKSDSKLKEIMDFERNK